MESKRSGMTKKICSLETGESFEIEDLDSCTSSIEVGKASIVIVRALLGCTTEAAIKRELLNESVQRWPAMI